MGGRSIPLSANACFIVGTRAIMAQRSSDSLKGRRQLASMSATAPTACR